jgi:O-antigen/teichoic acid export membrane protein
MFSDTLSPDTHLSEGRQRTARAYRNILYSLFIKGGSIVSQFLMVPLTLHYLDKTQYGIWLTIASLINWFSFFDIGIGNGLRNKLAEAVAKKDLTLAKNYVSTSYALVLGIFAGIILIFCFINPLLNWTAILNVPATLNLELKKIILFVFIFFCIRFILALIGNILYAYQQPALNSLINPLGNIVSLILIYILTLTTKGSLFLIAAIFSAVPVLILSVFSIVFFTGRYKEIAPSLHFIHLKYSKGLIGLGIQFFIIQIAGVVLFTSTNILLTQLFGPDQVTVYNIAFRYFTIITMVFGIVSMPFWSAFTEAFVKKDFEWIRTSIRKMDIIAYALVAACLLMFLLAQPVYAIWVGRSVTVPTSMNLMLCLFVIITLLATPYNTFINGTGKIRLQFYSAIISTVITIPLAILFSKYCHMGPPGIILATLITTFPTMILWKIQYKKIISGKATGIWNK